MAITDIALPLEKIIKRGTGNLADDPQSGSIMKLLGENGFQAKISEGAKKGHVYTIIHHPPSTDFVLVDTWNEQGVQKKKLLPFTIKLEQQEVTVRAEEISAPTHPDPSASQQTHPQPFPKGREPEQPVPAPNSLHAIYGNDGKKPSLGSYDILKARFSKNPPVSLDAVASQPPLARGATQPRDTKFLENIFGNLGEEWNRLKEIPMNRFIAPEKFGWGLDSDGRPKTVTPDSYPPHAKKLYDIVAPLVRKNPPADLTITLETYVATAIKNNWV